MRSRAFLISSETRSNTPRGDLQLGRQDSLDTASPSPPPYSRSRGPEENNQGAPPPDNPRRSTPILDPGSMEAVMQQARIVGRDPPCRLLEIVVGLTTLLATGCAHVGECDSSDSTSSCCVKTHPGEYERCGAVAPPVPQSQPNRLLPGRMEAELPKARRYQSPNCPPPRKESDGGKRSAYRIMRGASALEETAWMVEGGTRQGVTPASTPVCAMGTGPCEQTTSPVQERDHGLPTPGARTDIRP